MGWEHDVIETIDLTEHYAAEIRHDTYPLDPRSDHEPMSRIVYFERGARQEARTTEILPEHAIGDRDLVTIIRYLRIFHGAEVALIRGYVHSGTALKTVPVGDRGNREGMMYGQFMDRWDSMWWGLAFVTGEDLKREYVDHGVPLKEARERAQEMMKSEVDELESWINGEVYRYTIVGKNGEDIFDDIGASCGGFFGYDHEKSGLLEYAKGEAEVFEEDLAKQMADDEAEEASMRHSELGFVTA